MQKMIGICGVDCTKCQAYIATQKNDNEERKKIAELWSSDKLPLKLEDINCDGCLAVEKRHIKFVNMCEVRACGLRKNVENCAHCDEYLCEKLNKHLKKAGASEAKATLEDIRKKLLANS